MLTFSVSGADGMMTVPETLTSGMVGKKVQFEFSPEWENLSKVAVFTAGTTIKDTLLDENAGAIPAQVLENPMRQLYVGVYGMAADGSVVIPTVRMKGPFIWPGANPAGDVGTDPEKEIWEEMLLEIEKLREAVESESGLNHQAAALLISILRNGLYSSDQSGAISELADALGVEEKRTFNITYELNCVNSSNQSLSAMEQESYTAELTAYEGYCLDSVIISMGGMDVTDAVYAGGSISIPAVTGDLVIAAYAVEEVMDGTVPVTWLTGTLNNSGVQTYGVRSAIFDVRDATSVQVTTSYGTWTNCWLASYGSMDVDPGAFSSRIYGSASYIDCNDSTSHPETVTFSVSNVSYVSVVMDNYSTTVAEQNVVVRKE